MNNKNDFDLDFFDDDNEVEAKEPSFEEFEKEAPSDNQGENIVKEQGENQPRPTFKMPPPPQPKKASALGGAIATIIVFALCSVILFAGTQHKHEYGAWTAIDSPTCLVAGIEERKCLCGETDLRYVEALGHSVVIDEKVEATCTATGLTEGKHCSRCNEVMIAQEEIAIVPHTEVIDPAIDPTCIATGLTEGKHCSTCNEIFIAQEEVPLAEHIEVVDKAIAPTCTKTGLTEGKHCSVCNEVFVTQEEVPMAPHTEVVDPAVPATCTKTGLTEGRICSVCDEVLAVQTTTPKAPHTEVVDKAVQPTCTKVGLTEGKHCSSCQQVILAQHEIPMVNHTVVVDKAVAPTCTKTGRTEGKHCSVCYKVLVAQNDIAMVAHEYDDEYDAKCNGCGFVRAINCKHDDPDLIKELPEIAATCIKTGLSKGFLCTRCGTMVVPQVETGLTECTQKEIIPAKSATCTKTGLTEGSKCKLCDKVLKEQEVIPVTECTNIKVLGAVKATCTRTGLTQGKECKDCGKVLVEQTIIPKTPHTYGVWTIVDEPTCMEIGREERVCECGKKETRDINAKGHTYGAWVSVDNKLTRSCNNCDHTETKIIETTVDEFEASKDGVEIEVTENNTIPEGTTLVTDVITESIEQETIVEIEEKIETTIESEETKVVAVYDISLDYLGSTVQPNGAVKVALPMPEEIHEAYVVVYINDLGEATPMPTEIVDGKIVFETTHFSRYGIIGYKPKPHKHSFDEWHIVKEPSCTEKGTEERSCHCGKKETREVNTTPHSYDDKYDKTCNKCGFVRDAECGHFETEIINGKAATCTETGLTGGVKCTKCGEIIVAQEAIPTIDCIESDWIIDRPATDYQDGRKYTQCTMCKKVMSEEVIPMLSKEYTLGMGLVFGDITNSQTNATIASVVLDKDGVIVACKIDAVYNRYTITDCVTFKNLLTKKELGNNYGLSAALNYGMDWNNDGIVREWFEQAAAFESWCIGKTVAEVEAMELQTTGRGYVISADDALLNAGCTIQITDFIAAVVKAGNDDQSMTFKTTSDIALGLGVNSSDYSSSGDEFEATVRMNISFAAVVTIDDVIIAALNDEVQPKIIIEDGEVTYIGSVNGANRDTLKTKRESKDEYGMTNALHYGLDSDYDGRVLEWYIQSKVFSDYVIGMTADEVMAMTTQTLHNGFIISDDDALLSAGCTIQIAGIKAVVAKSAGYVVPEPEAPKETITIWVSELDGVVDLTKQQIADFLEANPEYKNKYNFDINCVSEADAASRVLADVVSAPDIYCFAQDMLPRLVQAGAIVAPTGTHLNNILNNNDTSSIFASSVNGTTYAFPITNDNGYYMYYDKSIITNPDDLAQIVADCEAAGKNICFELENNAWYSAAFFFATGCQSNWIMDENGKFIGIYDTYNSPEGIAAMKGMQIVTKSSAYCSNASSFNNAAVVITGIWMSNYAEEYFGDNLGATDLPSFTVDGQTYHLGSFSGNKLMGVKPQKDENRQQFLMELASYLTGEECQMERYEELQWGPSNLGAQNSDAVKSNVHLSALAKQNQYATPMVSIHGAWWDTAGMLGRESRYASTDDDLQAALDDYSALIDEILDSHKHIFTEGRCECGRIDPNYVPPHVHSFVNGKCECGEIDPNYVPVPNPDAGNDSLLPYAEGTVLRMATGYNNGDTGLSFSQRIIDRYGYDGALTLADGKTYFTGDLKPTWVEVQKVLKFVIDDKYTGNSASQEFNMWADRLDQVDIVSGTVSQFSKYGMLGELVDISDYLDKMPNFKKFLDENPAVRLSISSFDENGDFSGIYYSPYFDGVNDIERMPLMRTDWVEKLLNGKGDFSAAASNNLAAAVYTPYMPTSGKVTVDVVNAAGTAVEPLTKDYDKAGNIIAKMNAAGELNGVQAVNMLRKYIDEAYNGYYGENRADLFIGQNAAWDADELVALLRCVVANPQTLNGTDSVNGLFSREDGNNQRRVDMFRFAGTLFGVRGLESRQDYLYVGSDGLLHDARQETATYDALARMNAMVQEGLISKSFIEDDAGYKSETMLKTDAGFMHYDYNQTQTVYNAISLNENGTDKTDTGEKYMAVMIPVARWYDGTNESGVYMRFTESWRSVKTDGWGISKAGVGDDTNKLHAALALIDYAYSEKGQILMSYGPDAFIKTDAEGNYVTFNHNGKEMPVIADATRVELWEKAGGNYTNYGRQLLGSNLSFIKSQAFEYQCTHEVGMEGASKISVAIALGTIKHPELAITENPWYSIVPTTLPNTDTENAAIKAMTDLSDTNFSQSKDNGDKHPENLLIDLIVDGYAGCGYANAEAVVGQVKNTWGGDVYLAHKNNAYDRLIQYYNSIK